MFKVYNISGKEKVSTESFFVKINNKITWLESDIQLNKNFYFSDMKVKEIVSKSSYAKKMNELKEGQKLIIQYFFQDKSYELVKMTRQEIETLEEIEKKRNQLETIKKAIQKNISVKLLKEEDELKKEIKKLKAIVN